MFSLGNLAKKMHRGVRRENSLFRSLRESQVLDIAGREIFLQKFPDIPCKSLYPAQLQYGEFAE